MGLFKFNEDVLTEIYFDKHSTSIIQKINNGVKEEMIAKNAIAFIVHYFSIVRNESETLITKKHLIKCFNNKFISTKSETYEVETDHKMFLYDIIENLSEYEQKAVMRYFSSGNVFHLSTCYRRNELEEILIKEGYSLDPKPKFGKYSFRFKVKNEYPLCKLNIMSGKDKVLLPLSASIVANYAFMDSGKYAETLSASCLDFLENYDTSKISPIEKNKIITSILKNNF